jgi:sarcosine oxidase delta subunit
MRAKPITIKEVPFASRSALSQHVAHLMEQLGDTQDWSSCDQAKTAFLWDVMCLHPKSSEWLAEVDHVELRWNEEKNKRDVWLHYKDGAMRHISVRKDCVHFECTAARLAKEEREERLQLAAQQRVLAWCD